MDINRQYTPFTTPLLIGLLPILLAVILTPSPAAAEFRSPVVVNFFDVGMGDAILIHQPDQCAVLVDAGPPGSGVGIGRYLRDRRIDHLDRLIVSHPHLDHFGGILSLPATLTIDRVYDNGVDYHQERLFPEYRLWRQQQNYRPLTSGEQWQCGDTVFTVLAAASGQSRPAEINDSSIVLLVEAGPVRLLLPGDIEATGRRQLLARHPAIAAAIVKIPHHARSPDYLEPVLRSIAPDLAVISLGDTPAPSLAALEMIERHSGSVWRTDSQGDLEIVIDERGWRHARP